MFQDPLHSKIQEIRRQGATITEFWKQILSDPQCERQWREQAPFGGTELKIWRYLLKEEPFSTLILKWEKKFSKRDATSVKWWELVGRGKVFLQEKVKQHLYEIGGRRQFPEFEIPLLLKDLKARDSQLRAHAALRLGDFGVKGMGAVPALIRAMQDREEQVSQYSADSLWKIGHSSEEVALLLMEALKGKNKRVRSWIEITLDRFTEETKINAFLKGLEHHDVVVRDFATETLFLLKRKELLPEYQRLSQHPNKKVQRNALNLIQSVSSL